jgi:uroporphyrin-III C-methyltransferase/precorrin-2 dehydrogenase/sirohydrochlorin ferrochelatase
MARLATLPLFYKLAGKRVVVAGGNEAAAWKAELLSAAGATVEVWAADPCAEMEALACEPPGGAVALHRSSWRKEVFAGAELVVGAAHEEDEAGRLFEAARSVGVQINVIDRPAYCTFQFGAVVNRSPLVVGISTDGAAPVFGQAIRSRIEALLPAGFARWVEAALAWRAQLRESRLGPDVRRRFWEAFANLALRAPERAPRPSDRDELVAKAQGVGDRLPGAWGHVSLVGAGPGNPELLTLSAVRALRSADVILYDDLVAPEILDFARREAKRMLVGKTGRRSSCRQDDINALMIGLAKSGKRVVRLKAGDPMIFGRAGEEIAALRGAGISLDVVPGVTAAQGAAASLEVSLTRRGSARRVQFVTGHANDGRLPDDLDLAAIADPATTTAVYMPLGTLAALTARLLAAGVDPALPACAAFNATLPDERIVFGTLSTIERRVQAANAAGPCLLLIGRTLHSPRVGERADCERAAPMLTRARAARASDLPGVELAVGQQGKRRH